MRAVAHHEPAAERGEVVTGRLLTADAHPEVAAMASARFGYVIPDPADPPQGARQ
jgi:hypothetical protein